MRKIFEFLMTTVPVGQILTTIDINRLFETISVKFEKWFLFFIFENFYVKLSMLPFPATLYIIPAFLVT